MLSPEDAILLHCVHFNNDSTCHRSALQEARGRRGWGAVRVAMGEVLSLALLSGLINKRC